MTFMESTQAGWKMGRENHRTLLLLKTRKPAFLDGEQLYMSVKTKCGSSGVSDCYRTKSFINLIYQEALSWFMVTRCKRTCLFIERNISVLIANESPPAPNSTFSVSYLGI